MQIERDRSTGEWIAEIGGRPVRVKAKSRKLAERAFRNLSRAVDSRGALQTAPRRV